MEYRNTSFAIYSISKLGTNYYVTLTPALTSINSVSFLYSNKHENPYSLGSTFKLYQNDKKEEDDSNIDSSKEIESFFNKGHTKPPMFYGVVSDIIEEINKTAKLILGHTLPQNLNIEFCDKNFFGKKYQQFSNKVWTENIRGFSVNGHTKYIYVLYDNLLSMMLTLGHEIGHILTPARQNSITEEAKAYAFEMIWLSKIKEENILSLSSSIDLSKLGTPQANGIHDVAFKWVNSFIMDNKTPKEIYDDIVSGELVIVE